MINAPTSTDCLIPELSILEFFPLWFKEYIISTKVLLYTNY
uniref:Uncharacterized protein n=1 Tax=Arundo donax TaxID=35708 RepID=A0A0A9H125_ARUDO